MQPKNHRNQSALLYTAVCAAGIFLSLYSVLLKLSGVPCFTGGCLDVINSPYGELFGIPVGLFSLALWISLLYPASRWSLASKALLVLGSIVFIAIQAIALRQFCLICCLHAVVCFAIPLFKSPERISTQWGYVAVMAAFLALLGTDRWTRNLLSERLLAADSELESPISIQAPVRTDSTPSLNSLGLPERTLGTEWTAPREANIPAGQLTGGAWEANPSLPGPLAARSILTQDPTLGYPWLSEHSLAGSQLVVSLSCGHCLRLIERVLAKGTEDNAVARVILLANSKNRALTRHFTAALLSRSDLSPHAAFRKAFGAVLSERQALLAGDAARIESILPAEFPKASEYLPAANRVLLKQKTYLKRIGIPGTPYLIKGDLPVPLQEQNQFVQPLEKNRTPQFRRKEQTYANVER